MYREYYHVYSMWFANSETLLQSRSLASTYRPIWFLERGVRHTGGGGGGFQEHDKR